MSENNTVSEPKKDYIMHDMKKVFDTVDDAILHNPTIFSADITSKIERLKLVSGYYTYKRLSNSNEKSNDLLIVSSDFYNIIDIISHIE